MMAKPNHPRPNTVSQALLALIATIPPAVAGSPLPHTQPPDFLCPFIERDTIPPSTSRLAQIPPSKCDAVADKYVQGSDSLWRKTERWTLYGSTCWSSTTSAVESQPSRSLASVPTSSSSSSSSSANFDTSVLPAGWDSATTVKSSTESTIILALAIVLAGLICLFMIGCVIWRRRKKKARDIERKLRQQRTAHLDSQDDEREKDPRGKMRIWARATARWKSNVRQSARRRRKRLVTSSAVNRPLSPTLSDSLQLSLVAPSVPSRRASIASEEPEPSRSQVRHDHNVTEPPAVLHDIPPCSALPPTYGASLVPASSRSPPSSAVPSSSSIPSPVHPNSVQYGNCPPFIDDEPLPYVPPSDGHVATDDKSQLAHIRELASSPPMIAGAASTGATQPVSAPEWHEVEDDLEDLGINSNQAPMSFHNFGLPPSFPPPPSKVDIPSPFGYLDDYPLRYGHDLPVSPPAPGSPGTSLGAFPSAPPIDDPSLEPSAPPLEGDDELFQDWDGASSYVPEVPTSVNLDSAPVHTVESSTVSSASHGSTARDSILPRYQP